MKDSEPELDRSGSKAYKNVEGPVQFIFHLPFSLFSDSSERSSHFSLLLPPLVSENDGRRGWRSGRNLQGPPESSSSPARSADSDAKTSRIRPQLLQSTRLLTLSVNLTLKSACKAWINVDLQKTLRFSKKILGFFFIVFFFSNEIAQEPQDLRWFVCVTMFLKE